MLQYKQKENDLKVGHKSFRCSFVSILSTFIKKDKKEQQQKII